MPSYICLDIIKKQIVKIYKIVERIVKLWYNKRIRRRLWVFGL